MLFDPCKLTSSHDVADVVSPSKVFMENSLSCAGLLSELKQNCHVLSDFVPFRASQVPEKTAFQQFDRTEKVWKDYSYRWLNETTRLWQKALAASHLERGSRIGILLGNSINAVLIDQATLANALTPVPMHAIDTPRSSAFLLSDSGASCFFTSKLERWESIERTGISLPDLKLIVLTEEDTPENRPEGTIPVLGLSDWHSRAEGISDSDLPEGPTPEDLAAIVYTSGTTGNPKGVMLTHANIVSNIIDSATTIASDVLRPDFHLLSFLPLSHTFERTTGYYLPLGLALTVTFTRSIGLLTEDFKIVRPHMLISVPRIYERVYSKVMEAMRKAPFLTRVLFNACVNAGWRNHCRDNKMPVPFSWLSPFDRFVGPALRKVVAPKVLGAFGGRLSLAIAGGAALSAPVAKLFCGLGLHIVQGYGMTECSPVISVNTKALNDPRTVGVPLPEVNLRLDPKTKEIQIKSPCVMKGYWHRPEETAQVIRDGWLCTGDVGEVDEYGQLRIRGRIKEIIVTSTGEKVPPVDLENALEADPLFTQTCVIGEDRPYITFLTVVDEKEWETFAKQYNIDPHDPEAYKQPVVRAAIMRRAKIAAAGFPHYALPRNVVVSFEPWTVENGLLTPTLKIKRKPLCQKFQGEIEAMYAIHK